MACSTTPEKGPTASLPKSPMFNKKSKKPKGRPHNKINMVALMDELDWSESDTGLGYQEVKFNTCDIESNSSANPKCMDLYASRLNFQVMCRNSTGTVSRVNLEPLITDRLRWKSRGRRGIASTDGEGMGELGFVTRKPAKNGHLYFYLGNKIARKRFLDQWKLVLPQSWCRD